MRKLAALSLVLALCLPLRALAAEEQKPTKPARPRIELVFAIDTTSSMGGLIQAAKTKVWSIVNQISTGKPTPEVRMGLVAYRDRGDAYVTQVTDLTADLDAMYSKLMGFQAQGGGDGPESVNQALADAVNRISWSEGNRAMKIIFLVGDYQGHMDYEDDQKYPVTTQQAVRKNITIHTIRCGSNGDAETQFKDIAVKAEGTYFSIEQSGGAVAVVTPYDADIAKVDGELRTTTLAYGGRAVREESKKKMAETEATLAAAPAEAKANRAAYASRAAKAAPSAAYGSADLLSAVESKSVSLEKVADEELPDE
ncbi:MAG: VWA domain-containing protein [Myxococcales bacterium]